MANLERIYTIPLGDAYLRVRTKRAKRAVAFVRAFALRHMKAVEVKISEGVNSLVFRDGMQKPPRRIKVRILKSDDGVARVWLIGEEERIKAALEKRKKEEDAAKKKEEEAKKAAEEKKAAEKKAAEDKKAASAKPAASAAQPQAAKPAQANAPAQASKPATQPQSAPAASAPKPSAAPVARK